MEHRALGSQGLTVGAQGLGCMGMSAFYGATDETESLATIDRALELGVTLLDTAESYGPFVNEQLLGKALAGRREVAVVATKTGVEITDDGRALGLNGRPEYVRRALERSLRHLGTDHVDLYYLHRIDPNVPIEETVGSLAELVAEGKVGHIGLSEAPHRPSGVPTPSTRSPPSRPSTRSSSAASNRTGCATRCRSWESAWSPTPRWGAASCPA